MHLLYSSFFGKRHWAKYLEIFHCRIKISLTNIISFVDENWDNNLFRTKIKIAGESSHYFGTLSQEFETMPTHSVIFKSSHLTIYYVYMYKLKQRFVFSCSLVLIYLLWFGLAPLPQSTALSLAPLPQRSALSLAPLLLSQQSHHSTWTTRTIQRGLIDGVTNIDIW